MIESLPSSRVFTLPETGASSISAPISAASAARARLAAGLIELMSTKTLPGERPAMIPSGPRATDRSAVVSDTMEKTTSLASVASRAVSAHAIPASMSQSALDRVRLCPVT